MLFSASSVGSGLDRERWVCGGVKEPLSFYLWRKTAWDRAGIPPSLTNGLEKYQFTTPDKRVLRGYRIRALAPALDEKKTALLFLQGNVILAEDVVYNGLRRIMIDGSDAIVLNYRGYGPKSNPAAKSDGTPRIEASIEDTVDFVKYLQETEGYSRVNVVGVSFGGIIALNAVGRGAAVNRLVIDSVYSRISSFGCPKSLDPVTQKIPRSTPVLLISGGSDSVITPTDQSELRAAASSRDGWTVVFDPDFQHPFTDPADLFEKRLKIVHDFLEGQGH